MVGAKEFFLLGALLLFQISAQNTAIEGKVVDASTFEELDEVKITLEGTVLQTFSQENGNFVFSSEEILPGSYILVFIKHGYNILRFPIVISEGGNKNLDLILLQPDLLREQQQIRTISLTDNELNEDEGSVENVAGLLQASRDVFLNAAAFDFSQTFFKPRGLDSEYGKVYINGVEMNKLFTGRSQWSNWGGLNDVQRNQVFHMASLPAEVGFGGIAGSTNIVMRAGKYGNGGRISFAAANRSYVGRLMATYNSGELPSGWAYSFSVSRRFAEEGFSQGTPYDANSFFLSVEKKIGEKHSLNFTGFYTPNLRGKSSANTSEVFELRGNRYNSFWGYQNGKIRNSRMREIKEPVFMVNHYWKTGERSELNTNVVYQFGRVGNSRIDFGGTRLVTAAGGQESFIGGGSTPDPAYYQNLPSYFLRFRDSQNFQAAYRAQQDFVSNGQINWAKMYTANITTAQEGGNAIYIVAEDRNDDRQIIANSIFNTTLSQYFKLISKIEYTSLLSENFASVKDLLGGTGFLDVDVFAEGDNQLTVGDRAQNDLRNRNRLVGEGDRFKYNYELNAKVIRGYSHLQYKSKRTEGYISLMGSKTKYQRTGLYQSGSFPENSLGNSNALHFTDYGFKAGSTFRITGRHLLDGNFAYYTKAPTLRNSFTNSRQNNDVVLGLSSEKILSVDVGYIYRTPIFRTRLTGYYIKIEDATEISFYYADGLSGLGRTSTTAFVQEVLTGINKEHLGVEMGIDFQVTSTIKLKAAAAVGQYIYANNPNLYLTSDDFPEAINYGKSFIKNYRIAGGPQRAAQLGFEYRDPGYWWFGTTVNFFSHAFADISPLTRTGNFLTDADGLPILEYDQNIARKYLKQEQFDDYILVNAIGGKSWRVNSYYIGFFVSLNNIFDVLFKIGGFEQSRNANYRTLKADRERDQPVFGSKYWYGAGATYYANVYFRF